VKRLNPGLPLSNFQKHDFLLELEILPHQFEAG
jgi:hypothetical protein